MDTLSPKRTKQESAEAMGNLIGMGWKMVESIESGVRGVGVVLAVRIQRASAEYALKHGKAVAAAGLQLPIRCEDWCAE